VSRDVVLMLVGSGLGSLFTLGVAWYASRGSRRMLQEIGLLLRGLEEAGLVEFARDKTGRARGLVIERNLHDGIRAVARITTSGEVSRSQKQDPE
jgi:hypothetical protein